MGNPANASTPGFNSGVNPDKSPLWVGVGTFTTGRKPGRIFAPNVTTAGTSTPSLPAAYCASPTSAASEMIDTLSGQYFQNSSMLRWVNTTVQAIANVPGKVSISSFEGGTDKNFVIRVNMLTYNVIGYLYANATGTMDQMAYFFDGTLKYTTGPFDVLACQ